MNSLRRAKMTAGASFISKLSLFFCQHYSGILNTVVTASSGVPRNFVRVGGGSTNSVGDRGQIERGSGGGSPLVRGCGGSCNLVQEISFHIVNFF